MNKSVVKKCLGLCAGVLEKKWRQQDSNLRPSTRQADALPTELCLHDLILTHGYQ